MDGSIFLFRMQAAWKIQTAEGTSYLSTTTTSPSPNQQLHMALMMRATPHRFLFSITTSMVTLTALSSTTALFHQAISIMPTSDRFLQHPGLWRTSLREVVTGCCAMMEESLLTYRT